MGGWGGGKGGGSLALGGSGSALRTLLQLGGEALGRGLWRLRLLGNRTRMNLAAGVTSQWGSRPASSQGAGHMSSALCSWRPVHSAAWLVPSTEGAHRALESGLPEDPLACLSGRGERTHLTSLSLGWGAPQPSKGTPYVLSGKTPVLFQPLLCPLCECGILWNSRQSHFV